MMQWNFLAAAGVNAPVAWANLIADHRPGGLGVIVAVLPPHEQARRSAPTRSASELGSRCLADLWLWGDRFFHGKSRSLASSAGC